MSHKTSVGLGSAGGKIPDNKETLLRSSSLPLDISREMGD